MKKGFKTHINWHAVIQPLPNHCLSLNIDVLAVLNGQSLDVFTVQVQRDRLGLHTESNLVPVAVKQAVNFRVFKYSSDSIFCEPNSVVLHCLVLAIQTNGHLTENISERRRFTSFSTNQQLTRMVSNE